MQASIMDIELECTEILTPDSLQQTIIRRSVAENDHMLKVLLDIWKQGCDAVSITNAARDMLYDSWSMEPTTSAILHHTDAICPYDPDDAGLDDLDALSLENSEDFETTGFGDFYGVQHECVL